MNTGERVQITAKFIELTSHFAMPVHQDVLLFSDEDDRFVYVPVQIKKERVRAIRSFASNIASEEKITHKFGEMKKGDLIFLTGIVGKVRYDGYVLLQAERSL